MKRLISILALIGLSVSPGIGAKESLDRIVAVAGQEVVLASELEREVLSIRAQLMQRGQSLPELNQLRRQVLERLIMQRLQLAHAQRAGIRIDDATLEAAVQRIAAQNNMTLSQLRGALAQQGMGFGEFRSNLREDITIRRLHQAIVQQEVNVSQREIDAAVKAAAEQDNIEYRVAHIRVGTPEGASAQQIHEAKQRAMELREQVEQKDADFQALAQTFSDAATAEDGGVLNWRLHGQLPSSFAEVVSKLKRGEISEVIQAADGFHIVKLLDKRREGAQFVEETKSRQILIKTNDAVSDKDARQRLESFLERIREGESMAYLARMYSDESASEADGGSLGWTSAGELLPKLQEQLEKLDPGEISEPFRTQYGWHIVRVEDSRQRDVTEQLRRQRIAQQIFERKSHQALEQWQRQLREESYVDYRLESS